jgi:hypothetical protein
MKLIFTRIFPAVAISIVVLIFVRNFPPANEQSVVSSRDSHSQVTAKTAQQSASMNVAAIARKARPGRGISREQAAAPNATNDIAKVAKLELRGPDWSSFLQRHAKGDKEALPEFLKTITRGNALSAWKAARRAKLSPSDRNQLYSTLGRIGGGELVNQLLATSDPNAALAVKGWGQADPAGAMDWFRQLDLQGDEQLQKHLSDSHQLTEGFLDKVSDSLLDSLQPGSDAANAEAARETFATEAIQLVESLMDQDSRKAESMMRELTERLIQLYEGDTLADWVTQLENPVVQSSAVQRIIEAGLFKNAPMDAVDWAVSLPEQKSREHAVSAAFGQLGSGVGGIDPAEIANQLNQMEAGREKDFAINGFAHGLVGTAPEDALTWAASISDEDFRKAVTDNVTRRIEGFTANAQPPATVEAIPENTN